MPIFLVMKVFCRTSHIVMKKPSILFWQSESIRKEMYKLMFLQLSVKSWL